MQKKNFKNLSSKLFGIIFVLFVISHFVPVPYQVMEPGVAEELSPMIEVDSAYQNEGEFLLTAVGTKRAMAWDYFYITLFSPSDKELSSIRDYLPENMDLNQYIELMAELMEESKLQAQAVAFEKAGYQVQISGEGALVVQVMENGSAYNKLEQGDLIKSVDGKKVEMAADAVNIIKNRKIGDLVELKVLREEELLEFNLRTVELEGNKGSPSIGVLISSQGLEYDIPRKVNFKTENIIGPSAGGVFTLEIYNQLTERDITNGKKIAGTGTISLDGKLGRIDGVKYKIMAAKKAEVDLFIVPKENYETAAQFAGDLKLIKADNINDVLNYLKQDQSL
ncbi:YlbL family protein [Halanaerobium praevalens]|uniref:endopeptidase La n=1 Tax=Halanaerobium praevalens (strain ATCC 33744 / DSM 2228 / GSL) TaxID=572479 RepID=E3DQU9_HALPG|nr:S16 family serine protease [Halanaerobium praevalens]ADO76924.1 PDZ/DHR/GLGF domain protein [Halanaerobium praevalens DSM 2228]